MSNLKTIKQDTKSFEITTQPVLLMVNDAAWMKRLLHLFLYKQQTLPHVLQYTIMEQ